MTEPRDSYAAIFDALAHPCRRRILISLNFAGGEMSAGAIAALFATAWPTTTRHLQQLQAAGLVTQERRGRTRLYRLERAGLRLAADWLDWFDRNPATAEELNDDRGRTPVSPQRRSRGSRGGG